MLESARTYYVHLCPAYDTMHIMFAPPPNVHHAKMFLPGYPRCCKHKQHDMDLAFPSILGQSSRSKIDTQPI